MSISAVAGATASNSTAATTLTVAFTPNVTNSILVAVAIANTSASVSTVTDTASTSYSQLAAVTNPSNDVRIELWQGVSGTSTSTTITVTLSASSLMAIAAESYAGPANSAYQALNRTGWGASSNDVYYGAAANAIDGNVSTIWATNATMPCWLILDMLTAQTFTEVTVLPRQDGYADFPGSISIFVSDDGTTWGTAIYSTTGLPNNASLKTFSFASQHHRYLQYEITAIASGARAYQGAAEVNVLNGPLTIPPQATSTNTGTSYAPTATPITTEDLGNWTVAAIGFVCNSGDTVASDSGTLRQYVVPALTSVGVALVDVSTNVAPVTVPMIARLSASRDWAVAAAELRTGAGTSVGTFNAYAGVLPIGSTAPLSQLYLQYKSFNTVGPSSAPAPVAVQIAGGIAGAVYSETITTAGGVSPFTYSLASGALPTGTTLSSAGVISGTPLTPGTYSFNITSTDSGGHAGTQAFAITIVGAMLAANSGYTA